jgi:hypothetical protein
MAPWGGRKRGNPKAFPTNDRQAPANRLARQTDTPSQKRTRSGPGTAEPRHNVPNGVSADSGGTRTRSHRWSTSRHSISLIASPAPPSIRPKPQTKTPTLSPRNPQPKRMGTLPLSPTSNPSPSPGRQGGAPPIAPAKPRNRGRPRAASIESIPPQQPPCRAPPGCQPVPDATLYGTHIKT